MNITMTDILELIIAVLLFVFTRYALPWIKTKVNVSKIEGNLSTLELIFTKVEKLVEAAEQKGKNGELTTGAEKKEYVLNCLKAAGITVDGLDDYIEAAVHEMNASEN